MPGQPEVDDARLIALIAQHDSSAMDELVRRHGAALFRHARSMAGGDATLAEDALQDTLMAVLQHAATFRGEHPRAWLFTIARNAVRRQARRRGIVAETFEPRDGTSLEAAGFGSPERAACFERAVESRELVRKSLALLSDTERDVIALVDVEGLSLEETAAALELSLAATKSRLHRARLHLMALLTEAGGP